jgi:hypothetical protein
MGILRHLMSLGLVAVSVGSVGAAQIDMMSPAEGTIGTRITILGSGFGTGKTKVRLTGGGKAKAKVVQASDTQVVADVKVAKAGSYTVVVRGPDGEVAAPQPFLVRIPTNLLFEPPCPDPGTIVTMRARFLGNKKGVVKVGGKKAKVTSWTADLLGDGTATLKLHKKTPRGATNVSIKTKAGTANVVQALAVGATETCVMAPSTTTTTIPDISGGIMRVVSAIADSNTTILVTFSEAVDVASASNPAYYAVTTSLLSPDSPVGGQIRLPIAAAEVLPGYATVRLTTCSQSQAKYNLKVGPVLDALGRPISPPIPGNPDPSQAAFVGAPGASPDTDGDGLSDAAECLGWIVRTTGVDPDGKGPEQAETTRREVSSGHLVPDTDGDGLSDLIEQQRKFDPRSADTDADELTDYQEWNEIFSDATRQDSDGDGLDDGVEFNFLRTSPIFSDSDGDQVSDGDELATATRNPRVAELPTPAIEIGSLHAELNLGFEATTSSETRNLTGRDLTTELKQGTERSLSSMSRESHEVFAKLGVESTLKAEIDESPEVSVELKVSAETGWTGNWTSEWTQASKTSTETSYNQSLKSEDELKSGETLVRRVNGAKITTDVTLRNLSDVSFTMKKVSIAAFIQDPRSSDRLTLLASLVPASGGLDRTFEIGPGEAIGPIEFTNTDVFPTMVDALLRDQRGVVFNISSFTITDEADRVFNYVQQEVTERTSRLLIDYGGWESGVDRDGDGQLDRAEQYRVSTQVGRDLGDGHFAIYDENGKPLGITLPQALAAVGLTRYTRSQDASLTPTQKRNSYSTYVDDKGIERIWRIRDVARSEKPESIWLVIGNDGVKSELDLNEYVLMGGDGARDIRLAFLEDKDGDGLPATVERLNGCSDNEVDTDDDGLSDRQEVALGWEIKVLDLLKGGPDVRHVYSRCNSQDSDGDGLTDLSESVGIQYGGSGFCTADEDKRCRSDPMDIDTDHDGLLDHNALCAPGVECNETAYLTNIASYDSDNDSPGIGDANEIALGGDPLVYEPGNFADADEDTLPDVVENSCNRAIVVKHVAKCTPAGVCSQEQETRMPCSFSDREKKDTDGDGLTDAEELQLGLDPNRTDTDGDGIEDGVEGIGPIDMTDCQGNAVKAVLDPRNADSDADGISDGAELAGWRVQANDAVISTLVTSNPLEKDCDNDDLLDSFEARADRDSHDNKNCNVANPPAGCIPYGTDPRNPDTDDDGRSDSIEYASAVTKPAVRDREVTVDFRKLVISQCNLAENSSSPDSNYGSAEAIVELGLKLPGKQQETILLSPFAEVAPLPLFTPKLTSINWSGPICALRSNAASYFQHGCVDTVKLLSGTTTTGGTGLLGLQIWHEGDEPFLPGCSNRPGSVYLDNRKISFPMQEQANQCFTIVGEFSEFDGPYPISHSDDRYTDTVWYLDQQPWFFLDFGVSEVGTLPQVCWPRLQGTVGQTHHSRLVYGAQTLTQSGRWIDVDITVR